MIATTIRDIVSLALTFWAAGWLLSFVLITNSLGIAKRLYLSLALSVPAVMLVSSPFIVTHSLRIRWIVLGLIALAIMTAWRQRAELLQLGRTRESITKVFLTLRLSQILIGACIVVLWWLTIYAPQIALQRPNDLPWRETTWYYWRLVNLSAASGGLPATIHEWGGTYPFAVEYAIATLHTAVTAVLAGTTSLVIQEHYRLVVLGVTTVAFYALWRRWMPSWWAAVAAMLCMTSLHLQERYQSYWVESFGFMLVVWSAWLLDEAFERDSKLWAALAGILAATAFLAHAEVSLLAAAFWLGISAGRFLPWIWSRRNRISDEITSTWHHGTQSIVRNTGIVVICCGVAFASAWVGGSLLTGGLERVAHITSIVRGSTHQNAQHFGQDPTWAFLNAAYNPRAINSPPPPYRKMLFTDILSRERYPGIIPTRGMMYLGLAGAIVILIGAVVWGSRCVRRCAVTWAGFFTGVYLVVGLMAITYHTYVPLRATFRLKSFDVVAIAGLIAGVGWLLTGLVRQVTARWLPEFSRQAYLASIATVPLLVVITAFLVLNLTPFGGKGYNHYTDETLSPMVYQAYKWLGKRAPAQSIVLVNGYTEGAVGSISGLNGWLDGRAPYLESSQWLYSSTAKILSARQFFLKPNTSSLPPRASYVVVLSQSLDSGGSTFPVNQKALEGLRKLTLIKLFGERGRRILIYKVK